MASRFGSTLALAIRAIEGRTATLDDPPHGPAAAAWAPRPAIDCEAFREIAELAVRTSIISQRRAAGPDGFGNDIGDCDDQAGDTFAREAASGAARIDVRPVQRFADVDVPQARNGALVEKERLDGCTSAPESLAEPFGIEFRRLRSKFADGTPSADVAGRNQVDRTETAGIIESEPSSLLRLDQQVIVRVRQAWIDSPFSGHPEVEDQRVSAIGVDQSEFPAAPERCDPGPGQPLAESGGKGAAEIAPPQLNTCNTLSEQHLFEPTDRCFDFGKFWHCCDMAEPRQGR